MSDIQTTGTIIPFQYGDTAVRTITIDGEPWFVAPDACRMLTLRDTTSALKMVDDEDKRTLRRSDTPQLFEGIAPQVQYLMILPRGVELIHKRMTRGAA